MIEFLTVLNVNLFICYLNYFEILLKQRQLDKQYLNDQMAIVNIDKKNHKII